MKVKLTDPRVTVVSTYGPYRVRGNMTLHWNFPSFMNANGSGTSWGEYVMTGISDGTVPQYTGLDGILVANAALRLITRYSLEGWPPWYDGYVPDELDPQDAENRPSREQGLYAIAYAGAQGAIPTADENGALYIYPRWPKCEMQCWVDKMVRKLEDQSEVYTRNVLYDRGQFNQHFVSEDSDYVGAEWGEVTVTDGHNFDGEITYWSSVPARWEDKTRTLSYHAEANYYFDYISQADSFSATAGTRRYECDTQIVESWRRIVLDGEYEDPMNPGTYWPDGMVLWDWGMTQVSIKPGTSWSVVTDVSLISHDSVQALDQTVGPWKVLQYEDGDFRDVSVYEYIGDDWWQSWDAPYEDYVPGPTWWFDLEGYVPANTPGNDGPGGDYPYGVPDGSILGEFYALFDGLLENNDDPNLLYWVDPTKGKDPYPATPVESTDSYPPWAFLSENSAQEVSAGEIATWWPINSDSDYYRWNARVCGPSFPANPIEREGEIPTSTKVLRALIDPYGTVFTTVPGVGVYRRDGNQQRAKLLPFTAVPNLHGLTRTEAGVLVIDGDGERWASEDDGDTWQPPT